MPDVLVLCYHAVSPTWDAPLSVTPEAFRSQLQRLEDRGYAGTTFSAAVLDPPDRPAVAVTFDDGMRSVLEHAAPILRELGWPATLYVPTDLIGSPEPMRWPGVAQFADGPDRDELLPLTWNEVAALRDAGWEIGSHTCSHPHLTALDDAELTAELERSKAACEMRLGEPCRSIAYPYGDVDERVEAAAAAAGYATGAALPERPHAAHPLRWPRVYVDHTDSADRMARRSRPAWRAFERSPAWPVAMAAARLRGGTGAATTSAAQAETNDVALLGREGRAVTGRLAAVAHGLRGRGGARSVHVAWPAAATPRMTLPPSSTAAAAWMLEHFEPGDRPLARRDPALWWALRARGAVLTHGAGRVRTAAERALGRPLREPAAVALYSASADRATKRAAFVWEGDEAEPAVVVKAAGSPHLDVHLRSEQALLAAIRQRAGGEPAVAAALPESPLWTGEIDERFLVAEPLDPFGGLGERPPRDRALAWLRDFHAATDHGTQPWTEAEERAALDTAQRAWHQAGWAEPERTRRRLAAALEPLRGRPLGCHAVHGDYWIENLAQRHGQLRVFDWEWAAERGRPLHDLVMFEVAGQQPVDPAAVVSAVGAELAARGADPAFATALLIPVLGELALRWRWQWDIPSGAEPRLLRIMRRAAELLPGA